MVTSEVVNLYRMSFLPESLRLTAVWIVGRASRKLKRRKRRATAASSLKGTPQDSAPRRMTAWLHEQRTSISPYGASDQRAVSTPERTSIEKLDGRVVAERRAPKDSFAGHQMSTPWDELHRAYFNGEALWTYLTTPFLLAGDGVRGLIGSLRSIE